MAGRIQEVKTPEKNRIKMRGSDKIFYAITTVLLVLLILIVGYPLIYVVSCSVSSYDALSTGRVMLWPVGFSLEGYEFIFKYKPVWTGYKNSIIYTFFSVLVTMFLQTLAAYPLSKRDYQGKKFFITYYFIVMLFHAGLIPTYLSRASLGLVGSPLAVILAGCVSMHNVLILRTAFRGVPNELYDAATVDGASEFSVLVRITLPLAKATISVLTLYSIVGCWNDYFNPMLYLRDDKLFTLQQVLRDILTGAESIDTTKISSSEMKEQANKGKEQIQFALIIVSTVPVFVAYLIVQKYFKRGVMIGSVKG